MEKVLFYLSIPLILYWLFLFAKVLMVDISGWYDVCNIRIYLLNQERALRILQLDNIVELTGLSVLIVMMNDPTATKIIIAAVTLIWARIGSMILAAAVFLLQMFVISLSYALTKYGTVVWRVFKKALNLMGSIIAMVVVMSLMSFLAFRKETPADRGYFNK